LKYLIVGLGNIGDKYQNTRHNIGFKILDALAQASNIVFINKRYGFVADYKFKARKFILVKPTTYVNLSGLAVNYWLNKQKIPVENLLVVVDDISLPFGTLRIRSKGGDAGHNGLINITQILGHQNYARLRFGIGSDFPFNNKVNYVLGPWSNEEEEKLPERIKIAIKVIKSYSTIGIDKTMNLYNNR
jgi:PTH1 family peptidyl-tRNA hydrolase